MVKRRKIQQKSEAESKAAFMLLCKDWIVNPLSNDFGFDFEVRLGDFLDEKTQSVSDISFYVQNKSSIHSFHEKAIEDLSIDDWTLFSSQRIPVLIVKYDIEKKDFYWVIAQEYLWDIIENEDQNWKAQKTKRITFTKKINNLDDLKSAIISAQKRITHRQYLNLEIGEGIRIDKDDLDRARDRLLKEYKAVSLAVYYQEKKKGNAEKARKALSDAYTSPKNDENKVNAIIGIIYELDLADPDQNKQIVALAEEGIRLCDDLKLGHLGDFIRILRGRAVLFMIMKRRSEIQVGLTVQKNQKYCAFSPFYTEELLTLDKKRSDLMLEINESLKSILQQGKMYYYIAALPILLDGITIQVMHLAVFDKRIIEGEKTGRKGFIEQCDLILKNLTENDLKTMLLKSLASYFYLTMEPGKALDCLSTSIGLAKEDGDVHFVENSTKMLEQIKSKPDPYAVPKSKNVEEMTTKEYSKMTEKILKGQGIDLGNDDDITRRIRIALSDMDPEQKFRHCENIHIAYLNTSPVGISIGLPSMGSKLIWCRYCKNSLVGVSLDQTFNSFVEGNCKGCKWHKPRAKDWVCTVKFVKDQETDPKFKIVVENLKKNW